ncbi:MAG: hypothetical protein JNN04_16610 [Cyclobacteriaceae bacterium]|nr:hypothetical protein [Cyclobacteriaceae bacterium]
MVRFVLMVLGLASVLFAGVAMGVRQGWFARPSYSDEIILFLGLAHLGLFGFILRRLDSGPEDFVKIYLGSTVLRILFFGLFIFLVIRLDPVSGPANALFFLLSYFLFTGLEVAALYPIVSNRKPAKQGQKGD